MEEYYTIYKYIYKDKESKMKMLLFARDDETANKMLNIANECNDIEWKPYRSLFNKHKTLIEVPIPPYELEQEQLECLSKELEHRKEFFKRMKIKETINLSRK